MITPSTLPPDTPFYRTARALYPHRPDLWEPAFVYEPLPLVPVDHPELPLFDIESDAASGHEIEPTGFIEKADVTTSRRTTTDERARPPGRLDEAMPARMLNEFVYCPRLFYYEYVEGVFVESEDTERGSELHKKVDKGRGDLPAARQRKADAKPEGKEAEPGNQNDSSSGASNGQAGSVAAPREQDPSSAETPRAPSEVNVIHSRSATLGSERLGVVAKMDLIEVQVGDVIEAIPSAPPQGAAVPGSSATDVPQSAVQTRKRKEKVKADSAPDLFSFAGQTESAGGAEGPPSAASARTVANAGAKDAPPEVTVVRRAVQKVTPVDYKAGAPRAEEHGSMMWDADKMQLGLQMLILRDNGYACDEGVIYYRATKQRVSLPMTTELEEWVVAKIADARRTATGAIPPPLCDSPKCVRCSLAPVCLPDETRMLARTFAPGPTSGDTSPRTGIIWVNDDERRSVAMDGGRTADTLRVTKPLRRLIAARDDERALYLNTPGYRVTLRDEELVVKDQNRVVGEYRTRDLSHVALFGNIQITTQAVQWLCEEEIPVAYFSMGGWFYGLTRGHGLKNVFTRIEQFQSAQDEHRCLALAQRFVHGKIRNHRTQLMRNHVNLPATVGLRLKYSAGDALNARSIEELLGIEGAAAALYFQHFAGMIKVEADDDELPGIEPPTRASQPEFRFDFTKRTRRPPTDPVNALLSLSYSLLAKDCTLAALAVGFDPYIGFYHQPRFGRPALALDLMEEFRPIIADSAVLTALNNRMITPGHFVQAGEAVNLTPHGRRSFFQAYEQRMNSLVTHPVFDYKASYRRVLELQARMLARYLTGEIAEYVPMMTR